MKTLRRFYISIFAVLFVLTGALIASAQIRTPRPSAKASVMQTIGVTDVTITYSRPGVKGRTIWGDPLPEQAATKGEATLDDQNVRPKGAPIGPGVMPGAPARMKPRSSSSPTTFLSMARSFRRVVTVCTQFLPMTSSP